MANNRIISISGLSLHGEENLEFMTSRLHYHLSHLLQVTSGVQRKFDFITSAGTSRSGIERIASEPRLEIASFWHEPSWALINGLFHRKESSINGNMNNKSNYLSSRLLIWLTGIPPRWSGRYKSRIGIYLIDCKRSYNLNFGYFRMNGQWRAQI